MTTITIPRTVRSATERLNGIESLLTAQRWERAAVVAAFVRPEASGGRPAKAPNGGDFLNIEQFAALGIAGLTKPDTVRMYMKRWLDAHGGVHPKPGTKVTLPAIAWEPTRTGTNGTSTVEGARKAMEQIASDFPEVAAEAARKPTVAKAIAVDEQAATSVVNEVVEEGRKQDREYRERVGKPKGGITGLLEKAMIEIGARLYEDDGRKFYENVVNHERDATPWRPGELEGVRRAAAAGAEFGTNIVALLTEVTDDDLQGLLSDGS